MQSDRTEGTFIGVGSVALMTAASIVTSLRGLPLMAKEEMTMFAYLAFTIALFLLPAALVSAELGGMYADRPGGVYAWVSAAFGRRWGFLAIWLQWVQNVVWFPVALAFVAAALAYVIGLPILAKNGIYIGTFCVIAYWLCTMIVLRGVGLFAKVSSYAFLFGTVLPGVILVGLLAYWLASGHRPGWEQLTAPAVSVLDHPRFWPWIRGLGTISFLAGIVLLFAGVEVQAVHVREMHQPSRSYPLAVLIGSSISALIFVLGALPIAAIIPYDQIVLQSAVFDTFAAVIANIWHMNWLVSLLCLLVAIGGIGGVVAWLSAPSRGLLATAHDGELPPGLRAMNAHGMPTNILLIQGIIATVISCLYLVLKDVSVAFFLLSAMTVALYLIVYMLLYAAAIRLRYTEPDIPRPFKVPGRSVGIWLTAGIGFLGVLFSFIVSFIPPTQLPIGSPAFYVMTVIIGTVVFSGVPLVLHAMRKPSWGHYGAAEP